MFPQSRFIYITRHPYEVFASTLKMMTTMHKMLSFTDEFPNDIENHVLQAYRYYYYSYEGASAKRELNPDQLLEIRYEDVVQAPIEVCERIYQKLNIEGFEAAKPYLKKWADSQKDYRPQVYDLSDELKDRIYQQWKPAFDRFGYSR